jgi:type II secretory pathway pseudopilin PulG
MAEEKEIEVEESEDGSWNQITVPEEAGIKVEVSEEDVKEVAAEAAAQPEPIVEESKVKNEDPELDGIETKGAEKRIRKLIRQRKERDEEIEKLIRNNEELNSKLIAKNTEVTSNVKQNIELSESQVNDKIELARAAYLNAFDSGDKEQLLKSQEILNQAQFEKQRIGEAKSALTQYEETQEKQQTVQQQQEEFTPDPKAMRWASENDWFGQDQIMTYGALEIDKQLKAEGYDPSDDDFYEEVNIRLKDTFPNKFGETSEPNNSQPRQQETSPAQVVAGTSRSPSTASNRKVKLSQEDIRLANKWQIPLEVYAAEKLKVDRAEGEYTNVVMNKRGG